MATALAIRPGIRWVAGLDWVGRRLGSRIDMAVAAVAAISAAAAVDVRSRRTVILDIDVVPTLVALWAAVVAAFTALVGRL